MLVMNSLVYKTSIIYALQMEQKTPLRVVTCEDQVLYLSHLLCVQELKKGISGCLEGNKNRMFAAFCTALPLGNLGVS